MNNYGREPNSGCGIMRETKNVGDAMYCGQQCNYERNKGSWEIILFFGKNGSCGKMRNYGRTEIMERQGLWEK
jgi:hypothetical protein